MVFSGEVSCHHGPDRQHFQKTCRGKLLKPHFLTWLKAVSEFSFSGAIHFILSVSMSFSSSSIGMAFPPSPLCRHEVFPWQVWILSHKLRLGSKKLTSWVYAWSPRQVLKQSSALHRFIMRKASCNRVCPEYIPTWYITQSLYQDWLSARCVEGGLAPCELVTPCQELSYIAVTKIYVWLLP